MDAFLSAGDQLDFTYGRLIELLDLFHAITGELDRPTASLPNISNIVATPSRFRRNKP